MQQLEGAKLWNVQESTTSAEEHTLLVHDRLKFRRNERARRMSTLGSGLIDWQAQDVGVKDTDLYFREFLELDA